MFVPGYREHAPSFCIGGFKRSMCVGFFIYRKKLLKPMVKNNFPISFESHIIDDVMDKTGGVYDRNQIRDVFRASISYANNLCMYTDNVSVSFPYVGDMVCNLHEMERRKHNLERLKSKVENYLSIRKRTSVP